MSNAVPSWLLALSLASLVAPQVSGPNRLAPTCVNVLPREPLVLYDVTGGTLTGPIDWSLVVFSDGSARLSSSLGDSGTGSSQLAYVDSAVTEALRADLVAAGALTTCDQPDTVSDTPLQTLTVHSGGGRRAHTFSWFTSDGNLAAIQALLDGFLAQHFPNPPGG